MQNTPYIAYYRVSTDRQGRSGLGLEAQQRAVRRYLDGHAGDLVAEFVEVESGRKTTNRPQLQAALAECRHRKTKLIIAKLDRLARSVHFITGLMESGVGFVAADMPNANDFMLHIYAAVAQEERRLISQRTRDALAAAKERGVELGKNGHVLAQQNRAAADEFALSMVPIIEEIKADGHTSIRAIAAELNRQGIPTMKGGKGWYPNSVRRLLARIKRLKKHTESRMSQTKHKGGKNG